MKHRKFVQANRNIKLHMPQQMENQDHMIQIMSELHHVILYNSPIKYI